MTTPSSELTAIGFVKAAPSVSTAQLATERLEQAPAQLGRRGRGEVRASPMPYVSVERELGDDEHATADIFQRAVEAAAAVVEDTQREELRRDALTILGSIVRGDGEQYREAGANRRDRLVRDMHGGGAHPLDDRAHRRSALLVQHPGVVAADDGLDLARGEMPGREHRHALFERQPCDVRDLPEAVAVLVQERLAVDLEALTAIGGCCGHTASMEKGPRARAQRVGVMSRGYSVGGQGTGAGGGASSPGRPGSYGTTSRLEPPSSAAATFAVSARTMKVSTIRRMSSERTGVTSVSPRSLPRSADCAR